MDNIYGYSKITLHSPALFFPSLFFFLSPFISLLFICSMLHFTQGDLLSSRYALSAPRAQNTHMIGFGDVRRAARSSPFLPIDWTFDKSILVTRFSSLSSQTQPPCPFPSPSYCSTETNHRPFFYLVPSSSLDPSPCP